MSENFPKMETTAEYVGRMIRDGYIDKDGAPLKCIKCEGVKFRNNNTAVDQAWGVMEYEVICETCGVVTGYWAYGSWAL